MKASKYIMEIYGTRPFARAIELNDADSVLDLMDDFSDYNSKQESIIPQTDNTRIIPVNVYDAKVFITKIQSQIEILEMVNKQDEAKHWKSILQSANELLNLNSK